jgi:hypothetical protein
MMNVLTLIDSFNYDYKLASLALLLIEQREGRETVEKLLEEIPSSQVQKNAKHFVNRLRELCSEEKSLPESHKLPGEKKYGKPVLKETSTV